MAEEVGSPDGHHDDEDGPGEIGGFAPTEAGAAANKEQQDVDSPTDERGNYFWIKEIGRAEGCFLG
jgi:hypothetical protein